MIGLLLFSLSTTVIAGKISCSEFVTFNQDKAQRIINAETESIIIPDIGDQTKKDLEKAKQQMRVSNLSSKCIFLRDAHLLKVDSLQRIGALKELSSLKLTPEEKDIYKKSLEENKEFFSIYSNASLVNKEVCQYPLLYLQYQKNTNEGKPLIFEQRLVSGEIKTFSLYQGRSMGRFKCGKFEAQKNYADLLNFPKPKNSESKPEKCKYLESCYFKASASPVNGKYFSAKNYKSAKLEKIPLDSILTNIDKKTAENEVFFKYKGKKYRISIGDWKKSGHKNVKNL